MSVIGRQQSQDAVGLDGSSPEQRWELLPELDALERSVDRCVESAKADNTLLAYQDQWAAFVARCASKAVCPTCAGSSSMR